MDTGFNYYHGADPSRVRPRRLELRGRSRSTARAGCTPRRGCLLGRRPGFLRAACPSGRRRTSSSTATATSSGATGWRRSSGEPSRAAPDVDFALGGPRFPGRHGRARLIGDVPFNVFARAISAARVNLYITRRTHATVYASSTCRPFELAACGAAIVSNPHDGIERWFEPGSELLVVDDADEALAAYRDLLDDPAQAEAMGARARERVLDEHTYRHRARQAARARSGLEAQAVGHDALRRGASRSCPPSTRSSAVARVVDEIRAFDRVVRRPRRRRRLDRPTRRRSPRAPARACRPPPVQPRDRRRRPDRLQVRARARATSSPSASTATASTTRPSSAPCSRPSLAGRGRHRRRLALRRRRRRAYRPSARAPGRDPRASPGLVSAIARQKVTDPTSGFQALNRRGDRPLRRRLPARLPGGRGARDGVLRHRLRLNEVPVTMREREHGRSSITRSARSTTWSRSCSRCSSASSARARDSAWSGA